MVVLVDVKGDASIGLNMMDSNPKTISYTAYEVVLDAKSDDDGAADKYQGGKEGRNIELKGSIDVDV